MTFAARITDDTRWRSVQRALRHEADRTQEAEDVRNDPALAAPKPPAEPTPGRTCRR